MMEFWLSLTAILLAVFAVTFVLFVIVTAAAVKLGYLPGVTLQDFIFWNKNDPVKHCEVFKTIGCAHIDGMFCNMDNCPILEEYRDENKINKE